MKKCFALALCVLSRAAVLAPVVVAASPLVACSDENDPKTWAKRLDDPATRAPAVKRLGEMFDSAMSAANNNRDDAKVKAVVDDSIDALTKTYTAGGLDDKTRKDLMKIIADMGDPRGGPAFAKAFKDYEPGKNDDDVKFAAQGISRLAKDDKLTDTNLVDALWECFAKFQPSKAKSINLVKDLQGAVKTVKHPSYGPRAVEKLSAPVDPSNRDQNLDHLQFWQLTSAQLIGDLKYTAGVKPLVTVLMTPSKKDLIFPVRNALHKMPKESEPVLIEAFKGEGDFANLATNYPERAYIPLVAEALAYISRPAGRDAILAVLQDPNTSEQNRAMLAPYLTHFPADPKLPKAYLDAYAKVGPSTALALMGGQNAHAVLAGAAANFYDPTLTDWLLKEVAAAKGEAKDAMPASALPAAIKLMTADQKNAVKAAVDKIPGQALEKDMFKSAAEVLDKCNKDVACYLGHLDTTIPTSPPAAKMGHVKAVWMAGIYGNADTKAKLLERVEKIKDGSVRLALLEAIDHLSPQGDTAAADKLEKLVETDTAAGNKAGVDEMYRVALKLRSRVP